MDGKALKPSLQESAGAKVNRRSFRLLAAAFVVTVAVLLVTFALLWMLVPRPPPPPPSVCQSETCVRASALLQQNVDLSADPCRDFYSFACGGYSRQSYSPATINEGFTLRLQEEGQLNAQLFELFRNERLARSTDSQMNTMYQAVREMFQSCVRWHNPTVWWLPEKLSSVSGAFNLKLLTEAVMKQIEAASSLEEFVAALVRTQSSGLLMLNPGAPYVDPPVQNWTLQSGRSRQSRMLAFSTLCFYFLEFWNATVANEAEQFAAEFGIPITANLTELVGEQNRMFNQCRFRPVTYSLSDLQNETDLRMSGVSFNWTAFLGHLQFDAADTPGIKVAGLPSFTAALQLLASQRAVMKGPLYDLIRLDAALTFRSFLPAEKFHALRQSYRSWKCLHYPGCKNEGSRNYSQFTAYCVDLTKEAMLPVVYDMYKKAFAKDSYSLVHSMVADIQRAMKENVNEQLWIQSDIKGVMRSKIDAIKFVVSYYEMPLPEIKSLFRPSMEIFRSARHFGDIVLMHQDIKLRKSLWFLTSSTSVSDANAALTNPFQLRATYGYYFNDIYLYSGFLSSMAYHKDYPEYLKYGGIGRVIGHEIAHGFDPRRGMKKEGVLRHKATFDAYAKSADCLRRFYSKLELIPNSTRVDGNQTLGENFADIVGLNAAFRAYKSKEASFGMSVQQLPGPLGSRLSPDQLFFVQAAQLHCTKMEDAVLLKKFAVNVHSPPRARLTGALQHSRDFARVFQCGPGDGMYLADWDRCHFW